MNIDVILFGWMKLNHRLIIIPEQVFEETHFGPVRATLFAEVGIVNVAGNVFPICFKL